MSEMMDPSSLAAYWRRHVDAWKETDKSQKDFCDAHELAYHRFVYWRKKLDGDTPRRTGARARGGFAAVVREAPLDTGLTLSLPNGLVVRGICAQNVAVVRALLDQFR
jgi:hypothetical protein